MERGAGFALSGAERFLAARKIFLAEVVCRHEGETEIGRETEDERP
jgi:hypothetical protein